MKRIILALTILISPHAHAQEVSSASDFDTQAQQLLDQQSSENQQQENQQEQYDQGQDDAGGQT